MKQAGKEICVILSTRDRASLLRGSLESLVRQSLPRELYEVIVVNNGSRDNTAQVIEEYVAGYPDIFHTVYEPVAGLSRSRNTGVRATNARITVFFDDDARASQEWLQGIKEAFADPQVGIAGGPIELEWTCPKPPWWEDGLDSDMGRLNYGDQLMELKYPRTPYGMNIAVKREVFFRVGLFRETMGRVGQNLQEGKNLMDAEEVELCLRSLQAGYKMVYHPRASITHLVTAQRANLEYIRRRAYWHGRAMRLAEAKAGVAWTRSLSLIPFALLKSAAGYALKHKFSLSKQREIIYDLGYAVSAVKFFFKPVPRDEPPRL